MLAVVSHVVVAADAGAQQPATTPQPPSLRVFIDCSNLNCDQEFFRTEMTFVDHVRDRQTADVHVLLTSQSTGSGGREVTLRFFGQDRFKGQDYVLTETFLVAASDDEVRRGLVRVMSLGLVPYALQTGAGDRLTLTVQAPAKATGAPASTEDPWDRWSLNTNVNGNSNGESSSRYFSINTNFNANRTTDETKVNLNARFNYRESRFELPESRTYVAANRDYGLNGRYVKSLDDHWSAGVRASWNSSTFNNQDWTWAAAPAIEWDLFPYSESTKRLLTLNYAVGIRAWNYAEETIFNKLEETRATQTLDVTVSARQRWGTVGLSAELASFVPHPDQNHASAYGNLSLNIARGLSINLSTSVEYIRDQITLPLAEATSEEVLVNQRQLATSYRYFVFFGVGYTFGSIFSPIVNPRFNTGF
jgi:hypothetical protein